jgi:hypothetical protein
MDETQHDRRRAYGFPRHAAEGKLLNTLQGRAMLALGPIRAHYSPVFGWTLDQKPCLVWDYVRECHRIGKVIGG